MKAKQLIKLVQRNWKPDEEVLLSNAMGYPAHDYEGQRFQIGSDPVTKTLTIKKEVE